VLAGEDLVAGLGNERVLLIAKTILGVVTIAAAFFRIA
jgi:hypothetical protein